MQDKNKDKNLFSSLLEKIATTIARRDKQKEPETEIPGPLLMTQLELEASLRNIINLEFFRYFDNKEDYFKQIDKKKWSNTFQTIEQYRILTKDKEAYDDLYQDIRSNLGIDTLKNLLDKVKDYYIIGMKNRQVLANIQRKIETYRDFTGNLLAYDDIYDSILKRIIGLQLEEKKPEKITKEEWEKEEREQGLQVDYSYINRNLNVYQIEVYPQGVNGGGGASCGYHSLKNSIFIIRSILGNPQEIKNVMDKNIIGQYIGPNSIWRNIIMKKNLERAKRFANTNREKIKQGGMDNRVANAIKQKQFLKDYKTYARIHRFQPLRLRGEWLKEDDIDLLAKHEKRDGLLKDFLGIEYTVIENIPMMQNFQLRDFSAYGTVAEIAQELQNSQNYIHGFSLGLMGHYGGGAAHWISLVVNKVDGVVQFIVADSIGTNRTNDKIVNIMIQELSK